MDDKMDTANRQITPTPYTDLNWLLRELVDSVQAVLQKNFAGAYLQGSFAVGDFDRHSDVDFIVMTEQELSDEQVKALQRVHERIYHLDSPWAQHLEGSYFPRSILCDPSRRGEPLWYLDHGASSLIRSDHCNTLIVRWVIREKGVVLAGPAPETLIEPIAADTLRREIMEVVVGWGQQILADPAPYHNRFYQGFLVLNFCRMLHDLHTGVNGSKRAGAEWAKSQLDPSWSSLIDRAWSCRPDPAVSVREAPTPEDFADTLKFVQYAIRYALERYGAKFWSAESPSSWSSWKSKG
jgi:predicted nucleotidyltransferase